MDTIEMSTNGSSFFEKDEKQEDIPDLGFINLFYFAVGGIGVSVLALVGLILNFLSVAVFSRFEKRTPTVFLLICLAVADSVHIVSAILNFSVPAMYPYSGWFKNYFFTLIKHSRHLYGLKVALFMIPPWLVVLVTVDRYIHLCSENALRSGPTANIKVWAFRVGGVVIFAFLNNVPRYFFEWLPERPCPLNATSPVFCLGVPSPVSEYTKVYSFISYVFVHFLAPFMIVMVLNVKMAHHMRVLAKNPTMIAMHKLGVHRTLIKMTLVIAITTLVPSLTVALSSFFALFGSQRIGKMQGMVFVSPVMTFFYTLSSCINFFIYGLFGKKFRLTLKALCCHRKSNKGEQAACNVVGRKRNAAPDGPKPGVRAISTIGSA